MRLTLTTVTLDAPDPLALAAFYHRLLGGQVDDHGDGWVALHLPGGGVKLAFQREPLHVPPVWPAAPGQPQMQAHLEVRVDDLEAALAHALSCGAVLAQEQPQDDVRVCLDPAGHPFCLWV